MSNKRQVLDFIIKELSWEFQLKMKLFHREIDPLLADETTPLDKLQKVFRRNRTTYFRDVQSLLKALELQHQIQRDEETDEQLELLQIIDDIGGDKNGQNRTEQHLPDNK